MNTRAAGVRQKFQKLKERRRVERRMAPLSKRLGGVLLEHKYFGTHLDDKGSTTIPQLEMKNF